MPRSPAADMARSALLELENLRLLLEPAGSPGASRQPAARKVKASPRTPQSARAARVAHVRPDSSHRPQAVYSEFRDLGQAEVCAAEYKCMPSKACRCLCLKHLSPPGPSLDGKWRHQLLPAPLLPKVSERLLSFFPAPTSYIWRQHSSSIR